MKHQAILNGHKSIGTAYFKSDPDKLIYAFRIWGASYWSGDLEHLRKTKREAYIDAGVIAGEKGTGK
jgi:hypothetical protein